MILQDSDFALCITPSSSVISRFRMSSLMGMLNDEHEALSGSVCGGEPMQWHSSVLLVLDVVSLGWWAASAVIRQLGCHVASMLDATGRWDTQTMVDGLVRGEGVDQCNKSEYIVLTKHIKIVGDLRCHQ